MQLQYLSYKAVDNNLGDICVKEVSSVFTLHCELIGVGAWGQPFNTVHSRI